MHIEEKSKNSRKLIIEAALSEFSEHGFEGASIRRICQKSGVTNGRLFHHFKTKQDLYLACAEECYRILGEYIERYRMDVCETLEKNSLNLFVHWQNFWRIHPNLIRFFISLRINPPREIADKLLMARRRSFVSSLKTVLREIFVFFYPDNPEQQAFLTGVWLSVLDYTVVGIGLQKLDLYADMDGWLDSQTRMFRKVLCAFLYGIDSEAFYALKNEQFSPLPPDDYHV